MEPFVNNDSIVRKIWSKSDTVLFIFAGAAAEFALNKAVDWLYFTGKLPADPIGRLFSTVTYARKIVFSTHQEAMEAIHKIVQIHSGVEKARGSTIPDWAYRDVLFMLIDYSIASFELLERKLSIEEKQEVYNVFFRVGTAMNLTGLPTTYADWLPVRATHLDHDLENSPCTRDLFKQYKKHLGAPRFVILKEAQKLVMPHKVKKLLQFNSISWLAPAVPFYRLSRYLKWDQIIKSVILPPTYKKQIDQLDHVT